MRTGTTKKPSSRVSKSDAFYYGHMYSISEVCHVTVWRFLSWWQSASSLNNLVMQSNTRMHHQWHTSGSKCVTQHNIRTNASCNDRHRNGYLEDNRKHDSFRVATRADYALKKISRGQSCRPLRIAIFNVNLEQSHLRLSFETDIKYGEHSKRGRI